MPQLKTEYCSNLFYQKIGSGPAVVLLHGFPADHEMWEDVAWQLGVNYTVIMPDLPGAGASTLDGPTSLMAMAQCVVEILDHENISRAVIGGHSMGGYVAFECARSFPERLSGLAIIHSTPLADDAEKIAARQKAIGIVQAGGQRNFVSQMIPNLFCNNFKQNHPDIVKQLIDKAIEMSPEAMINFYEAMMARRDHSVSVGNLTVPVMWVFGKEDAVTPYIKSLPYVFKSHTNFVSLYVKCAHMSMFEQQDLLNKDVAIFLDYCNHSFI